MWRAAVRLRRSAARCAAYEFPFRPSCGPAGLVDINFRPGRPAVPAARWDGRPFRGGDHLDVGCDAALSSAWFADRVMPTGAGFRPAPTHLTDASDQVPQG